MLDRGFAERLLRWATRGFFGFLALLTAGALLAYGLGEPTTLAMKLPGHAFIALGAMGLKVSYVARLAALDVIKPHPDGWQREVRPPKALPLLRLDSVRSPDVRNDRKRA